MNAIYLALSYRGIFRGGWAKGAHAPLPLSIKEIKKKGRKEKKMNKKRGKSRGILNLK